MIGKTYFYFCLIMTFLVILLTLFAPQTACSGDRTGRQNHKWLYEIRTGILAHDVPIWSLSREEGGVDFKYETLLFCPDILVDIYYKSIKGKEF
jgi:hypothetical protein